MRLALMQVFCVHHLWDHLVPSRLLLLFGKEVVLEACELVEGRGVSTTTTTGSLQRRDFYQVKERCVLRNDQRQFPLTACWVDIGGGR
jgi:hypothetical protein